MNVWIPANEMLPRKGETVIARTADDKIMLASYSHKIRQWQDDSSMPTDELITEWTSIPSYKTRRDQRIQDISLAAFPALPCDTVFFKFEDSKYYEQCFVSEVTWNSDDWEPFYRITSYDSEKEVRLTASKLRTCALSEEQYYNSGKGKTNESV